MKRILSLLLSIVMVLSMVPAGAFAVTADEVTEPVAVTEATVEETTAPTEEVVEEATVPTEEIVEETTAPTEEIVEETTAPTEEIVEETTVPTEEVVEETTVPTEEVVEETTVPTEEVVEETTAPTEEIVEETVAEEAAAEELPIAYVELPLPEEYWEAGQIDIWGTESVTLTAYTDPADAVLTWTLGEGEEAYATVTGKGASVTVTAADVSELHTVTVTGSCENPDGSVSAASMEIIIHPRAKKIDIIVNDEVVTDQIVTFDLDVLVGEEPNLYYQTTIGVAAVVIPQDDMASVTWSSSDKTIARVKSNKETGEVEVQFTGKRGYVDIIATANDGSGTFGVVTFNAVGLAQNITVTKDSPFVLVSGKSGTLKLEETLMEGEPAVAVPADDVVWELADPIFAPFASVTPAGKVTAKTVHEPVVVALRATVTYSTTPVQILHEITIYPTVTKVDIVHKGDSASGKTILWDVDDGLLTLTAVQFPDVVYGIPEWTVTDSKAAFLSFINEETNELNLYLNYDPNNLETVAIEKKFSTVTVKASAVDGSGKNATVKIKLDRYVNAIDISSDKGTAPVLFGGDSMQLTATASAKDVTKKPTNTGVTWSLKDPADKNYVTLSGSGKVTAKKNIVIGKTVTVVATAKDGYGAKAEFSFVVQPADLGVPVIYHEGMNVTNTTVLVNLLDNDTITLDAQVFAGPSPYEMHWKASSKTASVCDNGDNTADIQMLKTGSVTITAYDDFGNKAKVTVKAAKLSSGVEIASKTETFCVTSGKTLQLVGTVLPEGEVSDKGVKWWIEPSDTAYAKISTGGKITATKGLAAPVNITVWAQAKDGYSEPMCETVTVLPLSTGLNIMLDDENVTNTTYEWDLTTAGDYLALEAAVFPYTSDQAVTWKSSSKGVAKIDAETGEITIGKTGTATITATAKDGSGKKASFKLKVHRTMETLELDKAVAAVAGGKQITFKAIVDKNATNKKVTWSLTGDTEFATISQSGVLKAKPVTAKKEVTVIVTAQDNSKLVAECPVTIYPNAISKVQIYFEGTPAPKTLGLYIDETMTLEGITSYPSDAASGAGAYTWKSSSKCVEIEDNGDGTVSIYGVKAGTATITCTAADGSGKKATVKIKVLKPE